MVAITNLKCRIEYQPGTNLPVVLLLHGWTGSETDFSDLMLYRLSSYGLFVCSVGMRSVSGAGGTKDASGREIYDIYDALSYVRTTFPTVVSSTIAALVGYSGGGGNVLAAACKFPDAWNVVVDHFGMSDYGRNNPNGWYYNNGGSLTAGIVTAIGDTPANVPNRYYARDATEAIHNFSGGYLYMYHDKQDNVVPVIHSDRIKTAMDNASLSNYLLSESDIGDAVRFTHVLPDSNPALVAQEPTWIAKIKSQAAWTVPASGTHTVIGYMKNKRYTCWLNANGTASLGIDAVATVAYGATPNVYTVTPLTGAIDVTITQADGKTGTATNISSATDITVS